MKVFQATPDGSSGVLVAEFKLGKGGKLAAKYHDKGWRYTFEVNGVCTAGTGNVYPEDGVKFLRALRKTFSNSSRVWVEE